MVVRIFLSLLGPLLGASRQQTQSLTPRACRRHAQRIKIGRTPSASCLAQRPLPDPAFFDHTPARRRPRQRVSTMDAAKTGSRRDLRCQRAPRTSGGSISPTESRLRECREALDADSDAAVRRRITDDRSPRLPRDGAPGLANRHPAAADLADASTGSPSCGPSTPTASRGARRAARQHRGDRRCGREVRRAGRTLQVRPLPRCSTPSSPASETTRIKTQWARDSGGAGDRRSVNRGQRRG